MKAPVLLRSTILGLLPVLSLSLAPAKAEAQRKFRWLDSVPSVVVSLFEGPNGWAVADTIRTNLTKYIREQDFFPHPTDNINVQLEPSGFATDKPLSTKDGMTLAQRIRGDILIEGVSARQGNDLKLDWWLRFVNPAFSNWKQPMAPLTGRRADFVAKDLAAAMKKWVPSFKPFTSCVASIGTATSSASSQTEKDQAFAQAVDSARKAIALYPDNVFARECLMYAMANDTAHFPADSILKLAAEITQRVPKDPSALRLSYSAYKRQAAALTDSAARGAKLSQALTALLDLYSTDLLDPAIQQDVVDELTTTGRYDQALRILAEAEQTNPGDPKLVFAKFFIYFAVHQYKDAAAAGEELVTVDTAHADSTFYVRFARSYLFDSMPPKAIDAANRGIAKFPMVRDLYLVKAQALAAQGDQAGVIAADRGALKIDPNQAVLYLQMMQAFQATQHLDSAIATAQVALAHAKTKTDSETISQVLVAGPTNAIGALSRMVPQDSTLTDSTRQASWTQFEAALAQVAQVDSTFPSDNAKYLMSQGGLVYASWIVGYLGRNFADIPKETFCPQVDKARALAANSMRLLFAGAARANPGQAGVIQSNAGSVLSFSDDLSGSKCVAAAAPARGLRSPE